MIFGLDLLGIAKYPNRARRFFPKGYALGCFSNTFGDAIPGVTGVLETEKCPLVRVHLGWKDDHKFKRSDFSAIKKEAERWAPVVLRYPSVRWFFSGACEHELWEADVLELSCLVKDALPSVTYVNTPSDKGSNVIGLVNESHGNDAVPFGKSPIFSFDGNSCSGASVKTMRERFKKAEVFFLWSAGFNGKTHDKDRTARHKRLAWPDARYVKRILGMVR